MNTSHIEEHVNVEKNEYDVKAKQMELEFQEKLERIKHLRETGFCEIHPTVSTRERVEEVLSGGCFGFNMKYNYYDRIIPCSECVQEKNDELQAKIQEEKGKKGKIVLRLR